MRLHMRLHFSLVSCVSFQRGYAGCFVFAVVAAQLHSQTICDQCTGQELTEQNKHLFMPNCLHLVCWYSIATRL